jgi:DNA-binding XRE family transcriptional regulator
MTPEKFKSWRKSLGITQATPASSLGIGRRMVQNYEKGSYPVPRHIDLACRYLAEHPGEITATEAV